MYFLDTEQIILHARESRRRPNEAKALRYRIRENELLNPFVSPMYLALNQQKKIHVYPHKIEKKTRIISQMKRREGA